MTVDPRDGRRRQTHLAETSDAELGRLGGLWPDATRWLVGLGRAGRAEVLDAVAASLEASRA